MDIVYKQPQLSMHVYPKPWKVLPLPCGPNGEWEFVGTSLSSRDANSYLTNWRRKPAVLQAIFGWWFGFDVFCLSRFFITMRRAAVVTIIINRQWCNKDFDHVQSNYSTWAKTAPKQISLHFINRFKNNVFHRKRCSLTVIRSFCMEHDVIWFSSWWKNVQINFWYNSPRFQTYYTPLTFQASPLCPWAQAVAGQGSRKFAHHDRDLVILKPGPSRGSVPQFVS